MKKTLMSLSMLLVVFATMAQSLKSNNASLSYKLPLKNEFNLASYNRTINTDLMLVDATEAPDQNAANEEKKKSLASEYLGVFGKAIKYDKVSPELSIEFTAKDIQLKDVASDIYGAKEEDVVARIEGTAVLRYINTKTGAEVFRKEFTIPADNAAITRSTINRLDPGIAVQVKFTKKSDTQALAALYNKGLESVRLAYFHDLLKKASGYVKSHFEDQKGMFQMPIYYVKGKADYAQLEKTSEEFKNALKTMKTETSITALKGSPAFAVIQNCIAVWEKEIATRSNEENARISDEVARGLELNLATAYILTGEFEKAQQALIRSGFIVAEGTELSNTGTAKESFMTLRKMLYTATPAGDRITFSN
jgi:hypothetical protein